MQENIVVVGAGGWGTALSIVLSENFKNVYLWARTNEIVEEINTFRTNQQYLPNSTLPKNIIATTSNDVFEKSDIIVNAVPTQYIRDFYSKYNINLKDKYIVNASKGIENNSILTISGIFREVYGVDENHYCILTGPSHAEEVCNKLPTAIVAGSKNKNLVELVQKAFTTDYFRVYTSDDVIGCEIGGSLKNVIAIAAGILDGLGLGDNTKAALLTRGLAEIARLGVSLGANHKTFSGLSGLGDLFVTCNSKHSRNRNFGEKIGLGQKAKDILEHSKMVVEGVFTSESAYELSVNNNIDMPITSQIYNTIFEGKDPKEAINELMTRDRKNEWYS
jgi:glycerol-3-phosphate dehydrogenase (NAD(P)+)